MSLIQWIRRETRLPLLEPVDTVELDDLTGRLVAYGTVVEPYRVLGQTGGGLALVIVHPGNVNTILAVGRDDVTVLA